MQKPFADILYAEQLIRILIETGRTVIKNHLEGFDRGMTFKNQLLNHLLKMIISESAYVI